jgi:hypothetical protein
MESTVYGLQSMIIGSSKMVLDIYESIVEEFYDGTIPGKGLARHISASLNLAIPNHATSPSTI